MSPSLLGRHITRCSENKPGNTCQTQKRRRIGCRLGWCVLEGFGQSEVQYLDLAVRSDLHIRELQVTMNDTFFVCGFKCFADATGNAQCFRNRNRPEPDSLDKRLTFDELEHEQAGVVDFCDIIDRGDVGMVQRSEQLRFPLESGGTVEVSRK